MGYGEGLKPTISEVRGSVLPLLSRTGLTKQISITTVRKRKNNSKDASQGNAKNATIEKDFYTMPESRKERIV